MRDEDLSYFEEEDFKANLARYEAMLGGGPSVYLDADELTDIAEYYMVKNDEQRANDCIDYALTLHPGDVDPLIFRARQQMFKGNYEQARAIRDTITDQTDREVYFLNAELMIREKKADEASDYLVAKAAGMGKDRPLFVYDSACIFFDYELYEQALMWTDWLLQHEPGYKVYSLRAEILLEADRPEEAVEMLDKALDIDPYAVAAWEMMADAHFMQEHFYEAIEAADFALAIDEHDGPARLTRANSHFHQGHNEEAHTDYCRYIDEHEANELPYFYDGICLYSMGRYEEALERLNMAEQCAMGMSTEQRRLLLQQAFVHSKLGHLQEALDYLDSARNEGEEGMDDYRILQGYFHLENNDLKAAFSLFQQAMEESGGAPKTKYSIAATLAEKGIYEEAVFLFRQVMDEEPQGLGPACLSYLAYCYLQREEYDDYLDCLEKAGREDADNARNIFGESFPGVQPEEYYLYAYKEIKGTFPGDGKRP